MNPSTLPTWSDFARREQSAAPGRWDRLVALYAPVLGPTGGTLFDVGGRKLTGTPANTVWAPGPGGWRLGFNGTSSIVSVADSTPFALQPPFSVVLVVRPQAGIAQYDCAMSCSDSSGLGWRLWTRDASNRKWYWEANDGGAKNVAGLAAIDTTRREVVVAVHDGINLVLYVNGGLQGTTACGAVSYYATRALLIGNQPGQSRFFPMNLELAAVFSRAIRQPEAAEWFADPFALLRPAEEDVGAAIDDRYTLTRLGELVSVTYEGSLPPPAYYHWYLDGIYQGVTTAPTRQFQVVEGDQARVEVVETADPDFDPHQNPPAAYPARKTLWWARSIDAETAAYRIERQVDGGAWEPLATLPAVAGAWSYSWISERLADLADYAWRVVPIDALQNAGEPQSLAAERLVRTPDAPLFGATFDAPTRRVAFV